MTDACVIFDIDGTLVDSVEFDGQSYIAAVRHVLGNVSIRSNWSYEHITDSGILRQICEENGFEATQWEQHVKARFGELIADHLRRKGICPPIPGALRLLYTMKNRSPTFFRIIGTKGTATSGALLPYMTIASAYAYPHGDGRNNV